MTKEEILEKRRNIIGNQLMPVLSDTIYNMMDEHARQFSEKLIGWLNDNDFKFTDWKDNMQSDDVNKGKRMHASEIVDLFIEQQSKEQ